MHLCFKTLLPAALALASLQAQAQQSTPPQGKVVAIYVQAEPGVFVATALAGTRQPAETWSDLRLRRGDGAQAARREIARNPDGVAVREGDVLQFAAGRRPEFATGPVPEITRITARVAPADSRYAREFDNPPAPALAFADR